MKVSRLISLRSFVVAAIVATLPQIAYAGETQTKSVTNTRTIADSSQSGDAEEISKLKKQLYDCHHHKKRRKHRKVAHTCVLKEAQVIERTTVVERPTIIERERIVEKEVMPVMVDKEMIVERAMDNAVVVEHPKTRKHLLRFGIPFISVTLF